MWCWPYSNHTLTIYSPALKNHHRIHIIFRTYREGKVYCQRYFPIKKSHLKYKKDYVLVFDCKNLCWHHEMFLLVFFFHECKNSTQFYSRICEINSPRDCFRQATDCLSVELPSTGAAAFLFLTASRRWVLEILINPASLGAKWGLDWNGDMHQVSQLIPVIHKHHR